jgi:membrane protease YdiL (CAAX protease family)
VSQAFPASSLRNAALLYGGMTLLAVLLAWPMRQGIAVLAPPASPFAWLAGLAAGLLLLAVTALAERMWLRFKQLGETMASMLGPITVPQALLLGLLSGIGEESLFRGPLQVALGPVLATLLFAALHGLGNRRLWPWPLFAALAGGVFAWLAWQFHSPWPAAVAHVVVNAVNLRRLGLRYRAQSDLYV